IHAEHDELAMREVDEVHHAPDQREPRREEGIDRADEQPVGDDLQKYHARNGRGLRPSRNRRSPPMPKRRSDGRDVSAKGQRAGAIASSPSSAIRAWRWRIYQATPPYSPCPGAGSGRSPP